MTIDTREQLLEQLTAERFRLRHYCEMDELLDDCDRNVMQRRRQLETALKGWRRRGLER